MSTLFQLQIISPLILIPLYYSTKFGIIFTLFSIIASCFVQILPKLFGLPIAPFEVSDMVSLDQFQKSFFRYNLRPEQSLISFIIGILIGFIIANKEILTKFFNKKLVPIILWIVFPLFCSSAIIWGENFKDLEIAPNKLNLLLWFSFGKILWSLGCGSLILVLYTGNRGLFEKFFFVYF